MLHWLEPLAVVKKFASLVHNAPAAMGSHEVAVENAPTSGPTTETAVAPNAPSPGWQGATIKTSDPKPQRLRMYTNGVLEESRGDSPPGRAEVLGYGVYGWFGTQANFERAYKRMLSILPYWIKKI